MKVCMAQIEIRTGDIDGNTRKIIETIFNHGSSTDVIVFPELAISGYNCGSLFESEEFVDSCLEKIDTIKQLVGDNLVIIGCPTYAEPKYECNGNLRLHNSVFVIHNGEIIQTYDKILLANDFQHEDRKYFIPGENVTPFEYKGKSCGVLICEDTWRHDHDRDLVGELKAKSPSLEFVFCTNYSYFTYPKADFRAKLMQELSSEHNVFMFYLNVVGIGDIVKNFIVYDGRSLVYTPKGECLCEMASFDEDVHIVNTNDESEQHSSKNLLKIAPSRKGRGSSQTIPAPLYQIETQTSMRDHNHSKYSRIWGAMLYAQKKIFEQCGIKKAQVHVSGGVDSAIVAVLCAKAMGAQNCIFISNPSIHNGDFTKGNAQSISDKLGVNLYWVPIQETVEASMQTCDTGLGMNISHVPFVVGTSEATVRSTIGLSIANYFGSGIVSTGNHTENVLGWFTFHDIGSLGVYQPIGDLSKLELFELSGFINRLYNEDYIPEELWDEAVRTQPAAELADSTDDPFDYQIYSGICAEIIRARKLPRDLMRDFDTRNLNADAFPPTKYYNYYEDRHKFENAVNDAYKRSKRSVYKCAQASPLLIMSPRSRGFSSRETILNFYDGTV